MSLGVAVEVCSINGHRYRVQTPDQIAPRPRRSRLITLLVIPNRAEGPVRNLILLA
jgi:hypothetical protein